MIKESKEIAIFQSGRLGDLWMTLPLANHLYKNAHKPIRIFYDKCYGNTVFSSFPYVDPVPIRMNRFLTETTRPSRLFSQGLAQLQTYIRLKRTGIEVVWNQIYPWRWLQATFFGKPYPYYWYLKYPEILNSRIVPSTLEINNGKTILVFMNSQSLPTLDTTKNHEWLHNNLEKLVEWTGYKPIIVAYGDQPDHPKYETWRGSLEEYQKLIAQCGIVFGIITSAHILGQLLGKIVIPLYGKNTSIIDSIGKETLLLKFPENFSGKDNEALNIAIEKEMVYQ